MQRLTFTGAIVLLALSACVDNGRYSTSGYDYQPGYYEPGLTTGARLQQQRVNTKVDTCLNRAQIAGPVTLDAPIDTTGLRSTPTILRGPNVGFSQKINFDKCMTDNYK